MLGIQLEDTVKFMKMEGALVRIIDVHNVFDGSIIW